MLKLAIPVLHVTRAREAQEFYETLGFRLESANRADPALEDPCYMSVSRDRAWLHLSSFPGDGVSGGVVFFVMDDVDALYRELLARGVRVDLPPTDQTWGNREMYVKDADGNSLRFVRLEEASP